MARIELRNVSKVWDNVVALEPTNLSVADGEFVAVLGPSGCGKSTTLFILAGIYAPSKGEVLFDDQVVNDVEPRDRNIGIVFQSYALYPHMNIRDNIRFPLKFKKTEKEEAMRLVEESAKLVHIEEFLDRKPSQLSGGQQQRVALARALVKEPQLLLLDEPLSNLDATLRMSMRSEIKTLQQRLKITTILVTHDQLEAITMADRIICMSRGKIEQIGSPKDLYENPSSLFVASFIGAPPINLLEGVASQEKLNLNKGSIILNHAHQGKLTLGIRPENIKITKDIQGIKSRVGLVEPMGRETLYVLETTIGELRALVPESAPQWGQGEDIFCQFEKESCLFFDTETEKLVSNLRLVAIE
ncbi:MAG: ABC transporter ATP-binding protein [SAR324 cluster bacterium]|nr:ABC transporter ATP-binding protein [SAR324 cluster bacterium]